VSERTDVLFLAWTRTSGRSKEIAAALGGSAVCVFPARLSARRLFALRYAYSGVVSVVQLIRQRPRALIATNPPVFPGLIAYAYSAVAKVPYVLDSHPTSFGAKDHAVSQRLLFIHRWLARRASATMVTTTDWVAIVESWGGKGIVTHEAPPLWSVAPLKGDADGVVLFVGVFASDEPVMTVLQAARLRPELQVRVTGDLKRCPPDVLAAAPDNVHFVGYLGPEEYRAAIEQADVVVALTTEPTSIVRAGYEAVYARRPLVISNWAPGIEAFPLAAASENVPEALAAAFDEALSAGRRGSKELETAREAQVMRWNSQLLALIDALHLGPVHDVGDSSETIAVLS
jgi:hypothetical protein